MQELAAQTEGILWPTFPGRNASVILAILFQIEQTQWLPEDRIRARQFDQLAALLSHAKATVPFYRDHLAGLPEKLDGTVLRDLWPELPRLRRHEVQEAGDRLASTALPRSHGTTSEIFTSGSIGRPIRVLRSQLWGYYRAAVTMRDHLWHKRDMTGKLASMRDSTKGKHLFPGGTRTRAWSPSTGQVFQNGPGVALNVNTPLEQQIEWLLREKPDYLLTFPTLVQRLASQCLDWNISFPTLKQILTISEVVTPTIRDLCRRAWGLPLIDIYSSREIGYLALQCPEYEHYHIQAETQLVEILDKHGAPCLPGQIGQVVITPLHNFAMPLIRYEIGDQAEVGAPCPCGRGLPVITRILGRTQNMLVLPGGIRRWPLPSSSHVEALLAVGPIRQYQIVQKDLKNLEFRLVCERPLNQEELARLERWVLEKFDHPFAIAVSYHDEIPRSASGKYFDFVSEVPAA